MSHILINFVLRWRCVDLSMCKLKTYHRWSIKL